jgi:hypothetical protein
VTRGKRIGPDLVDVVPPRRLASDDRTGTVKGVGVVDAFPAPADSEHGCVVVCENAEAGRHEYGRLG